MQPSLLRMRARRITATRRDLLARLEKDNEVPAHLQEFPSADYEEQLCQLAKSKVRPSACRCSRPAPALVFGASCFGP